MTSTAAGLPVRMAGGLAGLTGWRRAAVAFVLGALTTAAMAPLHLVPLAVVSFTGLVWLLDGAATRRAAFWIGWWFGYGYFVTGLYWIASAFFVEPDRFALLAPLPVLGLPAVVAVFPALATLIARWRPLTGIARVLALALAWLALEYLRSHIFTGFPWNLMGYVWAFSPAVLQVTAAVGIHGLSLLTVTAFAMPALLADGSGGPTPRAGRAVAVAFGALALVWAGGAVRLAMADNGTVADVRIRIVQANIPQADKWQPEQRAVHLTRHLELTRGPGARAVTHVVWPETAVPFYLNVDHGVRELIAKAVTAGAPDRVLITGSIRRSDPADATFRAWNSVLGIGAGGAILDSYDKAHLVPFGEYLPFRGLLSRVGLDKLAHGAVDFTAASDLRLANLPGLPPARMLVCYEAIFPSEIVPVGADRPGLLVNVTNDAWFGQQAGPYQHFAMARTRAVEQGLPLLRAANTGISGIVDGYGRVQGLLGLGARGVLDGDLPVALAPTPYARFGDLVPLALWLAMLALLVKYCRRR
ncbi:MAG: apolipoprotein N-acyltransferase [Minwuiales bacterium]|nr:apolipoprotein N-acyltransferase [Minwuiales bacterium]